MGTRRHRGKTASSSYSAQESNVTHCSCQHKCAISQTARCPVISRQFTSEMLDHPTLSVATTRAMTTCPPCEMLRVVENMAIKYLDKGGVQAPPVPTNLVALCDSYRNIQLRPISLKACHGGIWLLGNEWVIHVNSQESTVVKRYTIFHEAFHIICHVADDRLFERDDINRKSFRETFADYFAASILMPRKWVTEKWQSISNIPDMAGAFGAPEAAMGLMIRHYGLI